MKLFVLILLSFFLFGCIQNQELLEKDLEQSSAQTLSDSVLPEQKELFDLCFVQADKCIKIEKSVSIQDQIKGLSFRESLPENQGMVFVLPDELIPRFWMKEMNFPIDMVWVSKDKKVIDWKENALPCETEPCPLFSPKEKIAFVLEVNSGFMQKNGIQVGEKLEFN